MEFEFIEPVVEQVTFYVHYDEKDLRIISISAERKDGDGIKSVEIDYELGLKFMLGEENPANWSVGTKNGKLGVYPFVFTAAKLGDRVNLISSLMIVPRSDDHADIMIKLSRRKVMITYDAEKIIKLTAPVKLYFTREDDPSYLKCALSIDVNILNQIKTDNQLDEWPNPLVLSLPEADDVLVFAVKNNLTVAIKK